VNASLKEWEKEENKKKTGDKKNCVLGIYQRSNSHP